VAEWWVERIFRRFDEKGLAVECIGDGRPHAGSWCPICGAVLVMAWSDVRRDITFDCRGGCDEEFVALELGAAP
jgi:hypothetical protein